MPRKAGTPDRATSGPDATAAFVEQLIDEDGVDFLLGPYSSTHTQRAIQVAWALDTTEVDAICRWY